MAARYQRRCARQMFDGVGGAMIPLWQVVSESKSIGMLLLSTYPIFANTAQSARHTDRQRNEQQYMSRTLYTPLQ